MKTSLATTFAASLALVLSPALAGSASAVETGISEDDFAAQMIAYANENPADVDGFEKLARDLGGTAESSTVTVNASELEPSTADPIAQAAFSNDVFTVNIVNGGVGQTRIINGSFNWRDDFAGQAAPLDIAALRFSSNCGTLSDLASATRSVSGVSTNRGSLRSAGVGTNAPIWNVDATTSGFENQADVGSFSARYDVSTCGSTPVQAAFDYEGNQGGSIVSVSASFAGLSVGYSNPGLTLQKSSQPITTN